MSASAVGAHAIKQISPAHIPNSAVLHSIALLHMLCSLVMDPELRELYNITVDRIEKAGLLQSTSAGKPRASGLAVEFSRGGFSVGPPVSPQLWSTPPLCQEKGTVEGTSGIRSVATVCSGLSAPGAAWPILCLLES